jgi:hypothetical protein
VLRLGQVHIELNLGKKSHFFFKIEKAHCSAQTIPFLKLDDGTFIYIQIDILTETSAYYENLYRNVTLNNCNIDRELRDCDILYGKVRQK